LEYNSLEDHNILIDYQHGFRQNRSWETQSINTIEHLAQSIEHRHQSDLLILDFSKGFNTVAHKQLLLKLDHYGIQGWALAWIEAWLVNWTGFLHYQ